MAASIDYAKPLCQATINLEGGVDGLAFVTGTEINTISNRMTSSNLNINRLRKHEKMAASTMYSMVNDVSLRLTEVVGYKDERV